MTRAWAWRNARQASIPGASDPTAAPAGTAVGAAGRADVVLDASSSSPEERLAAVWDATDGYGADVVVHCTGQAATFPEALSLVRPGGTIANIGVHGTPVELPMQDMWIQNVTVTMGLVDTVSIPTLLKMVASGRIPAEKMGTHSFTFGQIDEAYDVFKNAAANEALKVVITPG